MYYAVQYSYIKPRRTMRFCLLYEMFDILYLFIFRYIVKVIAYDSAYPDNTATATATIIVNRNPNPPVGPTSYVFNISVGAPIGQQVKNYIFCNVSYIRYLFNTKKIYAHRLAKEKQFPRRGIEPRPRR